jgi:hypothetical protein
MEGGVVSVSSFSIRFLLAFVGCSLFACFIIFLVGNVGRAWGDFLFLRLRGSAALMTIFGR